MATRINRAIELLAQDQPIYYSGGHTGHVLTREQGRKDAHIWSDYINVGMEHGSFDLAGLAEYMAGLVEGGPTNSGHRTPTVIVEAPVNGINEEYILYNAWQFRQILGAGRPRHPALPGRDGGRGARVRRVVPLPAGTIGTDPSFATPLERMRGADAGPPGDARTVGRCSGWARAGAARSRRPPRSGASQPTSTLEGRSLAAQPGRRAAAGRQAREPGGHRQGRRDPGRARHRLRRDGPWRPEPRARLQEMPHATRTRRRCRRRARRCSRPASSTASRSSKAPPTPKASSGASTRASHLLGPQRGERQGRASPLRSADDARLTPWTG